jgi:uncharacterized protein (DUF58 family)
MNFSVIRNIYINLRFYLVSTIIVLLFITGFYYDPFFLVAKISLLTLAVAVIADVYLLFFTGRDLVLLVRETPERFSNGDDNTVSIFIKNNHFFPFKATIVDEIPFQFQIRDYRMPLYLKPHEEKVLKYVLRPVRRGEYIFGKTNVYIENKIGLLSRRCIFHIEPVMVRTYPSFLNIRKFEFLAISNRLTEAGIKRVRRLGQHSEFDQIKEYVNGDDYRTINWKATAKKGKLMVNEYQDERAQQIYNLIDMGRVMKMPFEGMSLLDYAINSSLVLANTAVLKQDKAGLVTFNTKIGTFMPAERRNNTMTKMMEVLYNQETRFDESNFELLFVTIRRMITHRSLLVLYTNFESLNSMERQLPYFQRLARNHLLLMVVFENTEISEFRKKDATTLEEIYIQTIAEKFVHDKNLIVKELNNHGILSILTRPQDLSVSMVNKYLELKDRNLI